MLTIWSASPILRALQNCLLWSPVRLRRIAGHCRGIIYYASTPKSCIFQRSHSFVTKTVWVQNICKPILSPTETTSRLAHSHNRAMRPPHHVFRHTAHNHMRYASPAVRSHNYYVYPFLFSSVYDLQYRDAHRNDGFHTNLLPHIAGYTLTQLLFYTVYGLGIRTYNLQRCVTLQVTDINHVHQVQPGGLLEGEMQCVIQRRQGAFGIVYGTKYSLYLYHLIVSP